VSGYRRCRGERGRGCRRHRGTLRAGWLLGPVKPKIAPSPSRHARVCLSQKRARIGFVQAAMEERRG